jgi:L-fucose isomerase-like protein
MRIKIGYCPTRRDVFSREEAMRFNEMIRASMNEFDVDIVDLEGINEEKLLFSDADVPTVIDRFVSEKVDALFFPHCNFGSENRVAMVAKALNLPVLVWGPRDDSPNAMGIRSRDSQCGMFATGKVLRRHNVPFTYLTNSWIGSEDFKRGFGKFIRVVSVVKSLKNLNILQISTRPEPFCSVICNENELIEKFNVHLYPITLNDLVVKMREVEREGSEELKDTFAFIKSIDSLGNDEKIMKVASLKVAMKKLAKQYNCRAIAIQCWTALQDMADIMPCHANSLLTDEGIPTVCETDIHGAITAIMMQAAAMGDTVPFFADVTVRHPENDNAELLWHCGNFPYSLVKDKSCASVGCSKYHNNVYGICEWELKEGELTIARFDGDHGEYSLLIGEAKTTDGPKNVGSYVWIEVDSWPKWEHKLVEGPYVHHVSGVYGKYADILVEATKYIPALKPDSLVPGEEIEKRWI